jgi:hypothetical protein
MQGSRVKDKLKTHPSRSLATRDVDSHACSLESDPPLAHEPSSSSCTRLSTWLVANPTRPACLLLPFSRWVSSPTTVSSLTPSHTYKRCKRSPYWLACVFLCCLRTRASSPVRDRMRKIIARTPLISLEIPVVLDASEARSMEGKEDQQLPEPKALYVRPPLLLAKARRLTRPDAHESFAYRSPSSTPPTRRGSRRSELAAGRVHALLAQPVPSSMAGAVLIGTSRSTRTTRYAR